MTMMMKIILLSFLSAINIEDASSYTLNNKYTNSGFYQGHHKIEPNPQEPAVIPMPVHNIKYTNGGFYQGDSKIEVWPGVAWCETPPQSHENKAKYMASGFYQGLKSVPAVPLTSRQPDTSSVLYEGFDNKLEKKKKSSDLSDDEIYMLDEVEKFFENDVRIALLLKLIKKMALL